MVIDEYDMGDEKQDVAIITPAESSEEPEAEPSADDCKRLSIIGIDKYLTLISRSYEESDNAGHTGSRNRG